MVLVTVTPLYWNDDGSLGVVISSLAEIQVNGRLGVCNIILVRSLLENNGRLHSYDATEEILFGLNSSRCGYKSIMNSYRFE